LGDSSTAQWHFRQRSNTAQFRKCGEQGNTLRKRKAICAGLTWEVMADEEKGANSLLKRSQKEGFSAHSKIGSTVRQGVVSEAETKG